MSEISRTRAPVVVKAVLIRLAGIAQFLMVIASCSVCRSSSTTYGRLTRTVSPPADCQSHPYGLLETMGSAPSLVDGWGVKFQAAVA